MSAKTGQMPGTFWQDTLKRERALRGWTQADVAQRIGSDPKTVGRWERGLTFPSPYMCQQLSKLYEMTVEELGLVRGQPLAPVMAPSNEEHSAETAIAVDEAMSEKTGPEPGEGYRWPERRVKRWHLSLFCSLLSLLVLIISLSVWWTPLLRTFNGSSHTLPPRSDNPYTHKGVHVLDNTLTTNTAANWDVSSDEIGKCAFENGSYHIGVIKPGGYIKVCLANGTYFTDFTYEVTMRVVVGACGGLTFRGTSSLLYYFLVCQDGNYRFVRYDHEQQGNRRIITSGVSALIHSGLNSTNVLAVVASGETFALYINHMPLYQGIDGAYLAGEIGLIAHPCRIVYLGPTNDDCTPSVEVAFNDAKVWNNS